MPSLRTVGTEVAALSAAALSMPLKLVVAHERFDPTAPHPTPVLLVHGFFGDPTNFLVLRSYLASRGIENFASFGWRPRLDYQRLAPELGRAVAAVCAATGAPQVDIVGHSLGGTMARYLVELTGGHRVRRLVTLGAPYFASPLPPQEMAVFAAGDPFIPPPDVSFHFDAASPRVRIVAECGHWGLLIHPAVLQTVADSLARPAELTTRGPLALAAAH